ncbi:unnamed protein product, partial [Larinioides sclopetarius]
QSYLRSPYGDGRSKPRSPSKRYSPERPASQKRYYEARHAQTRDRHRDRALLNLAATKIQAAFRGYMTRKEFWRQ